MLKTHQDIYNNYTRQHGDAAARLAASLVLANKLLSPGGPGQLEAGNDARLPTEPPSATDYPSRWTLDLFWGDTPERHPERAAALYTLKDTVTTHEGRSLIVFRQGSRESVNARDFRLTTPLEIEVGTIATSGLVHNYAPRLSPTDRSRLGVAPPLIGYGVGVQVTGQQRLLIESNGALPLVTAPKEDWAESLVFVGAVPLTFDRKLYDRSEQARQERDIAVGNVAAFELIEALAMLAGRGAYGNLLELQSNGAISSSQALPDLRQIFSGVVAAETELESARS